MGNGYQNGLIEITPENIYLKKNYGLTRLVEKKEEDVMSRSNLRKMLSSNPHDQL